MELDYIREFVVLAEIGNYQKAADELFISQSSLSQHIKRLESQIGASLFNRSKYPIQLTPHGEAFRPYAERLTRTYQECSYDLSLLADPEHKRLRIGTSILDRYGISTYIAQFRRQHRDCEIAIFEKSDKDLRSMLRSRACDLIILRMPVAEDEEFESVTLEADPLIAVMSREHPLAGSYRIPLSALEGERFLSTPDTTLINIYLREMARECGFEPHISVSQTCGTLLSLVQCGNGVGIITKSMLASRPPDVVEVELENTRSIYANVLYLGDSSAFGIAPMFLDFLKTRSLHLED